MGAYEYFIGAISIVVGLSVGSLLTRSLALIGARAKVTFHWVPAVWALCILLWPFQYWYIGWQFNSFEGWSFATFLLLVTAMMSLYGAAELVLPAVDQAHPNLGEHFDSTGRIALGFFAAYFVLAIPGNRFVTELELADAFGFSVIPLALIGWAAAGRGSRARAAPTLLFLAYTAFIYWNLISNELSFGSIVNETDSS